MGKEVNKQTCESKNETNKIKIRISR